MASPNENKVIAQDKDVTPEESVLDKEDKETTIDDADIAAEKPAVYDASAVTYPEGGVRAWTVAVGASLAIFSTFGWLNSWGVFQEYYQEHQLAHETASAISWIGSMQTFFLFSGALFGGPLFDKYGERVVWGAIPVYLLSVFLTSLCKKYYQFMLCQGILCGMAMGMTMSPCFTATSHYFMKKRGAALGLTVAGSSLGGVIWPIVLQKLLDSSLSFGWSIRICAFAMVALLLVAASGIKARLPPRDGKFFLLHAFKELPYITILAGLFCTMIGVFIPIFYLPTYAVKHGMSQRLSFYLISILNGASFFGRVIPGILADKLGPLNALSTAAFSTAILILCWTSITSHAGLIVFAALYGFCSGAIVSLMSVSLSRVPKDPRQIGTYMGMGMLVTGVAALIGPPINGALVTAHNGSFKQASYFSGVMALVGGCGLIVAKWAAGKGLFAKI